MNFRLVTLIAVPALGAVSYLAYLQLQPSENTAHGRRTVSVDNSLTAVRFERGAATNAADLATLKGEVASLRAEILALRHQMPAQAAPVPSRVDDAPAPDVRSDPSARAEADRARLAQIETVEAAFREQVIDQSWSANTTSAIRNVLNSAEVGGLQAENIECRSSGCRVELHDDGTGRLGKSLPILAQQLAGAMPAITANTVQQGNGTSNVVLYMSRESGEQLSR